MNYEFFDLFSGIGGFALGLQRSGLKLSKHYFSEVDDCAIRIYRRHFPRAEAIGNIKEIDFQRLRKDSKSNIIITGGFPCQDISQINTTNNKRGLKGRRSSLWNQMYEGIRALQPQLAIIENVPNLLNRGFEKLLIGFAEIRYNVEWDCFRAEEFGLPHKRERLFAIAYPDSFGFLGINQKAREFKKNITFIYPKWTQAVEKVDLFSPDFWNEYDGNFTSLRRNNGISHFVDKIQCIGNSIVPAIAEIIFRAAINCSLLQRDEK